MNKTQESRFNMYLATVDFSEQNATFLGPLPNFSENLIILKGINDQIYIYGGEQGLNVSGTTLAKKDLRINVENLAADSARKAMAFATVTKNQILFQEINYSLSDLQRMPDTVLAETTTIIHDRIEVNLPAMIGYQVSTASQQELLQANNAYKASLSTPRIIKVSQKVATAKLVELFKTGDAVLKEMDAVVEIIRSTDADIYLGYKSARRVIETGTGTMSVKGLVTDVQTGEPIKGAVISFWPDGDATKTYAADEASLVKKTAEKGGFYVSTMPAGTYRVTLQKIGYAEQTLTVYVNDGELTAVDVKLEKIL